MTDSATKPKQAAKAVFTTGPTMRHVVVMTATSSIGLVSIFIVDVINLFYISLLGQQELAAAIGYAATIMFFSVSICIGISIATAALVGRALGAEDQDAARQRATSSLFYLLILTSGFALLLFPLHFLQVFFIQRHMVILKSRLHKHMRTRWTGNINKKDNRHYLHKDQPAHD